MHITKFEQNAIMLENPGNGGVAVIDPGVLSSTLMRHERASNPMATIVSHAHGDHFHINNVVELGAPVYGAEEVVDAVSAETNVNARHTPPGSVFTAGGFQVSVFAVDHGPISAPMENLGFLFEHGQTKVLFAGDMKLPSSSAELPHGPFDVVIVPVGDGKVFSPEEAAEWIREIGHRGIVVPCHYDGQADPSTRDAFAELADEFADVVVLNPGQSVVVGKDT